MKIQTLKERISKAEEKLTKLKGTLERHTKQMNKKAQALIDNNINPNNYNKFDDSLRGTKLSWDIYDYESKLKDIENTNDKIKETQISLDKYKQELSNQLAKDEENNNLIPEVLNIFLENWRQKCYDFYIDLAKEYIEILLRDYEITKEELEEMTKEKYIIETRKYITVKRYTEEEIQDILDKNISDTKEYRIKENIRIKYKNKFTESHFKSDLFVLTRIINHNQIDINELNEMLDQDVKDKKEQFINRIKQVIGDIKDLSSLIIGDNGEINGIAKGVKANAKIETITAGGYNIQCYHFRVLVNTIK